MLWRHELHDVGVPQVDISETINLKGMYFQLVETECFQQPRVNLMCSTCTTLATMVSNGKIPAAHHPAAVAAAAPGCSGLVAQAQTNNGFQVESTVMSFSIFTIEF